MENETCYDKMWINNRVKKTRARRKRFWCWGCDANHVRRWHKCEVCGKRNDGWCLKKDNLGGLHD